MREIWKIVPSYPELLASNLGRIKSLSFKVGMPNGGYREYMIQPTYGYEEKKATGRDNIPKRRIIRIKRYKRTFKIAFLVCEAFHGRKPTDKSVTIHIDENPSNNKPENLKWGTQKENLNMPKIKQWHRENVQKKFKW